MARLARFYGIDPERLLSMPLWVIKQLDEAVASIQAEESLRLMDIVQVPYMKSRQRRRYIRRLQRQANPFPAEPQPPHEVAEKDPEKAAAYFRSLGIHVIDGDSSNDES